MTRSIGLLLLLLAPSGTVRANWLRETVRAGRATFDGSSASARPDVEEDVRGKVTVRRIQPQCFSDWNNDPTALPYFFYQLRERTDGQFPCYVDNRGISLLGDEIFDYPIIYFTSHYPFTFTDDEVENLKKYLARGGTLWLDDCTGSGPFMDSVPANVERIAPGAESHLMLRSDSRFTDLFNMLYVATRMPPLKENFTKPFQAWYVNGRPAIIFCPNDYGCQWEVSSPPSAVNPLGAPAHAEMTPANQMPRELVYQFSINWLFYTLTH